MATPSTHQITELLLAWSDGDLSALERLTPLVYEELHRLAHRYLNYERSGNSLQTSALVNEAYLRLIDWKKVRWQNRAHFLGMAAKLMRHILVDFARERRATRRGGGARAVSIDEGVAVTREREADFLAVDDALNKLTALDPRKSQIVELRFFGGLDVKETAEVLKISPRTVMREWALARAWLYRELAQDESK
jgi:RNA polymerase sigma-70 factor (ECF subfamily)